MSTPDASDHDPKSIHDDLAAKTGHAKDAHAHGDDHGHEVAADFIREDSAYDKLCGLFTILSGVGLMFMIFVWKMAPLPPAVETSTERPTHEAAPPPKGGTAPAAQPTQP